MSGLILISVLSSGIWMEVYKLISMLMVLTNGAYAFIRKSLLKDVDTNCPKQEILVSGCQNFTNKSKNDLGEFSPKS